MQLLRLISFSIFILVLFANEAGLCNGKKHELTSYVGTIKIGEDLHEEVSFSTKIEKVMFNLNSVQNQYKVIRINIRNWSKKALHLSREKDKIEIYANDEVIPGVLDLSKNDPAIWDAFDLTIREILIYPRIVDPGEEENIFVFLPNKILIELPKKIIYTISTISKQAILEQERIVPKL